MPRISPGHFLFINRRGGRAGPGGRAAAAAGPGAATGDRRPARRRGTPIVGSPNGFHGNC